MIRIVKAKSKRNPRTTKVKYQTTRQHVVLGVINDRGIVMETDYGQDDSSNAVAACKRFGLSPASINQDHRINGSATDQNLKFNLTGEIGEVEKVIIYEYI